jgi:HK97 family phage portal protein
MASFWKPWTWFGSRSLSRNEGVQLSEPITRAAEASEPVNFDTAMQLSAFWAAARLWAETIASLPVKVQSWDGQEWIDDTEGDLSTLIRTRINRYQNSVEFFETFVLNHVVFGNAYAMKVRSGNRLVGLLPMNSGQVVPELLKDGSVVYHYHHDGGVTALSAENVWHWKMFGNGVIGLSPLSYARNAVSVGLAGDKRIGQVFKNAGKPSGVLTIDGTLKDDQRKMVRERFKDLVEGGTDTLMVLEAAMKFQPISMNPTDIQLLDSRRFQVEDVARFMDVPSVLINDTAGTTAWGSGIGQIMRGWYKRSLRNRVRSLQESMRASLIPAAARSRMRITHDFDDLLKLDKGERMEAHQKGINSGVITPNEARQEEDLPPLDGGDELYANGTIQPLLGRTADNRPPNARIDMAEDDT